MAVSRAVRRYYAERIFAQSGPDRVPPNFRPLAGERTGRATVEGCRGGGKNILEVHLRGVEGAIADVRMSCGLCNPAMMVAADLVADWVRGRALDEILAVDAYDVAGLGPLFEALGGPGWPDDAREKFQYVLMAVQNAARDHRGEPLVTVPDLDSPTDRDWADDEP